MCLQGFDQSGQEQLATEILVPGREQGQSGLHKGLFDVLRHFSGQQLGGEQGLLGQAAPEGDTKGAVGGLVLDGGFHQRSKWKTCDAAVRLSPVPPALSDRRKTLGPYRRSGSAHHQVTLLFAGATVQEQHFPAERLLQVPGSRSRPFR